MSDAWLAHHAGDEKGFSLGFFDPAYVVEFPVAVARVGGRIVAFATLWTTALRGPFSIDLMRYADDAPKDVMDFLFVELIAWGAAQGYLAFDFGMAPLAGLADRPLGSRSCRVGRLLFQRGEDIYEFPGAPPLQGQIRPAGVRATSPQRAWAIRSCWRTS